MWAERSEWVGSFNDVCSAGRWECVSWQKFLVMMRFIVFCSCCGVLFLVIYQPPHYVARSLARSMNDKPPTLLYESYE